MENIQIKLNNKPLSEEELQQLSKEDLIYKIKSLEAHNQQLKNIIAKSDVKREERKKQKPFDFAKCNFRHILLKFFYLGWDYHGYSTQEDTANTIEYHLFNALTRTCLIKDRTSSNYHRCGRTDKGVSSFGQVVSLDIRSKLQKENQHDLSKEIDYCTILNKVLPDNIQCVAWCPVKGSFSARFDCNSRTYKYFFPKGRLDIENMRNASKMLLGSHDYRNFCKMDVGNGVVQFIRNIIHISVEPTKTAHCEDEYDMYAITIKGKAFLWHQIRCIMGILFLVGQKKEKPEIIQELLNVEANPSLNLKKHGLRSHKLGYLFPNYIFRKPEYSMASEIPLNLFCCDYEDVQWHYNEESLQLVIKKLRATWTFTSIKQTMMKTMLDCLEQELKKILEVNSESETNQNCLTECLMVSSKPKNYVPVMKRQRCESLEEKIKHFTKRNRIEILNAE